MSQLAPSERRLPNAIDMSPPRAESRSIAGAFLPSTYPLARLALAFAGPGERKRHPSIAGGGETTTIDLAARI